MEITFDSLSWVILAAIVLLSTIHLLLLRKPDAATHPLLLGRQSELSQVRKPNESPAFISSSAGLGGTARQQLKDVKSIQDIWQNRHAKIVLGTSGVICNLAGAVLTLRNNLRDGGESGKEPLTIRLEDPGETLLTALASSQFSVPGAPESTPLLISTYLALSSHIKPPLILSISELSKYSDSLHAIGGGRLYVISALQQGPQLTPSKPLSDQWKVTKILIESLSSMDAPSIQEQNKELQIDDTVIRIPLPVDAETGSIGIAQVTHKNFISGGIISLLTIFPTNEKPTSDDRILSFECTSKPYGLAVALTAASTGATMRLCSPHKGITSKCRTFLPSIIFCTPNELNAIRVSLGNQLFQNGILVTPAVSSKTSLLRSGTTSKTTIWDTLLFDRVRKAVVGPNLRCIVCSAEQETVPAHEILDFMRVVLGIPIVVALTHPLVAGPVANTLYHDYQRFSSAFKEISQVGCPSATVEAKLTSVNEQDAENGRLRGQLAIKGPSVIQTVGRPSGSDAWLQTGIWAELQTNGTLKIIQGA